MINLDELEKLLKASSRVRFIKYTDEFSKEAMLCSFIPEKLLELIFEIRKLREANGMMLNAMSEVIVIGTDYERRKYMGSQVMEILTDATNKAAKIMGGEVKTEASYLADLFNNIPECDDLFHVFGPGDSGKSKCRCGLTYSDGKYARSLSQRNYTEDT